MTTTTVEKTIEEAQAAMTVKRAFGEPFQANGLTIVPTARVAGGAGGGGDKAGEKGFGTGFGLLSQPMGVYVIDEHDAHWVPATTPNPLVTLLLMPIAAVRSLLFGKPAATAREIPVRQAAPRRAPAARKKAAHKA